MSHFGLPTTRLRRFVRAIFGRALLALAVVRMGKSLRVRIAVLAVIIIGVIALVGPHLGGADAATDSGPLLSSPSLATGHLLGTDGDGHDMIRRLSYGTRTSFFVALSGVSLMATLGVLLGATAGFVRGFFDTLVTRLIEALSSFPSLLLVLAVQALVPHPTTVTLLLAIALTRWTEVARVVRTETLRVTGSDYVLAARALGAHPVRLLARHVLPNAIAPAVVAATFGFGTIVLVEASLDFLHVGAPTGVATWGETMSQAREHPEAWWLLAFPGGLLFAVVASINIVGEALQDAMDPRLER